MCVPFWTASYASLVMNVVPGDDIVETCGNRVSDSEDESPVKGFPQQLQDFLALITGWQVGNAGRSAVPHPRVLVLGL